MTWNGTPFRRKVSIPLHDAGVGSFPGPGHAAADRECRAGPSRLTPTRTAFSRKNAHHSSVTSMALVCTECGMCAASGRGAAHRGERLPVPVDRQHQRLARMPDNREVRRRKRVPEHEGHGRLDDLQRHPVPVVARRKIAIVAVDIAERRRLEDQQPRPAGAIGGRDRGHRFRQFEKLRNWASRSPFSAAPCGRHASGKVAR